VNPSHRRAGWRHCRDGRRYNVYVDTYAERIPGGWWVRDGKEIALRAKGRTFPTWGNVHRARLEYIPGRFGQTVFGVDMGRPGGDRTVIMAGRRHGKRAEFSLYVDGHKVPGVTGISFGERPFEGVDRPPVEPKPRLSPLEQMKADAEVLFQQSNMYWAFTKEDYERMTGRDGTALFDKFANMTCAPEAPPVIPQSPEQLIENIREFREKFPPPPETMLERVQREMGKVPFVPIPPAYFDESFDQVVTAEFERMKKLIWPKDDAEPEARMMLREAVITELRRRRKLGIPDPKYLRAQEPKE
jgi:hypothetical protein